jgi:hypothetical protein
MKGLTPYQGLKRCFGLFDCHLCSKTWSSGYSWANTPQRCKECSIWIYPETQLRLKKARTKNKKPRPHLQELCGKCCFRILPCRTEERYFA